MWKVLFVLGLCWCEKPKSPSSSAVHIHRHNLHHNDSKIMQILHSESQLDMRLAEEALINRLKNPTEGAQDKPFDDIIVDFKVHSHYVQHSGDKYFIGPRAIKEYGKEFITYSFGCANEVAFENCMSI